MRPIDSSYDRMTVEIRADVADGARTYALIVDHDGPCSEVGEYDTLAEAIEAARAMDTDSAPTELEDAIGYDATGDRDAAGLITAAEAAGWVVVAVAPAGECWTVLSYEAE